MGKLIYHGPGGVQEIVLSAGLVGRKPGELAIKGYGPQDQVELELIFPHNIDTVSGKRRDFTAARKGETFVHAVTRRYFNIKIRF